jgi:Zn ribbon nucleic-acid-binding protein
MGRKRIIKIPKTAAIKCPLCGEKSRIAVPREGTVYFFECKKCKQRVETPPMRCCIICAFSTKKCISSLLAEARQKGLEIRD